MKKIILEDNMNVHMRKFRITLSISDDDVEFGFRDNEFPSVSDIEYACEESYILNQSNSYIVSGYKITNRKSQFTICVANNETDKYMPDENDIEYAMVCCCIDGCHLSVREIERTISRNEWRDDQLHKILN